MSYEELYKKETGYDAITYRGFYKDSFVAWLIDRLEDLEDLED